MGQKQGRKKVVTTLYLTAAQARWSKAEAKRRDTSQANVLREAIESARNGVEVVFGRVSARSTTVDGNDLIGVGGDLPARIGPKRSPVRS